MDVVWLSNPARGSPAYGNRIERPWHMKAVGQGWHCRAWHSHSGVTTLQQGAHIRGPCGAHVVGDVVLWQPRAPILSSGGPPPGIPHSPWARAATRLGIARERPTRQPDAPTRRAWPTPRGPGIARASRPGAAKPRSIGVEPARTTWAGPSPLVQPDVRTR